MESFDIEFRSELRLRFFAQFANGQLTHFVSQGLSRPRDIPVGLGLRHRVVHVICVHVLDHLVATPVLVVNPGVYHQPNRAK